jgi:YD repeat-containing protein
VIVVADSRKQVPDTDRTNNTVASADLLSVSVPVLVLDQTVSGTIANGQDVYYRVDVPAGQDVRIAADFSTAPEAEIYVRHGSLPDRSNYDQTANLLDMHPQIFLTGAEAGPNYILIHGREAAGSGTAFQLTAQSAPFGLRSVSLGRGGKQGQVTVTLLGAGFSADAAVSLVASDGTRRAAAQVQFQNSGKLFATFDLSGLNPGAYDVRIDEAGQTTTAAGAFTVTATKSLGQLQLQMFSQQFIRPGQQGLVAVDYVNASDNDVPAPILTITSDNADFRMPDQNTFIRKSVQLLAINHDGPAGVLPPGAHGTFTLFFLPEQAGPHITSNFTLSTSSGVVATIDWNALKDSLRPSTISADAWDPIFANLITMTGSTLSQYQALLDDSATYLSQLGIYTSDIGRLFTFAVEQADSAIPMKSITAADVSAPAPGFALTFIRSYRQSLSGRYSLGPLGRGWSFNWDGSATTDPAGDVTIEMGGMVRSFSRMADGTYMGMSGDHGMLALENGRFQLREADGFLIAFRTDGRVDFMQDLNGNRITAGYSGGELISLTHSNGQAITLGYSAQGRISQVTDPAGATTTYTYDPTG